MDNRYNIDFLNLKEGKYELSFSIDKSFLDIYQNTDINDLDISVKTDLEKTSRNLILKFDIEGKINVQCDRCLDNFDLPIKYNTKLFINFGEETSDLTDVDDTMVVSKSENSIDLSKHFYDYIILQIPIKKVHPDDDKGESTCNIKMLEHIENIQDNDDTESIDPRWEKLKNLYN